VIKSTDEVVKIADWMILETATGGAAAAEEHQGVLLSQTYPQCKPDWIKASNPYDRSRPRSHFHPTTRKLFSKLENRLQVKFAGKLMYFLGEGLKFAVQ
jgi:hypothetical protein